MKKIIFIFFFSACFVGIQAQTPWYTNGNGSTTSSDFIGTTASQPLIFKTNGIERMQLLPNKSFLGIGVSNPLATLHLHFQQIFGDPSSPKLLQLTTYATGNGINNGFCIFSDEITRDIKFKQQEQAKFFIEGVGGGFVVAPTGKIGFGTDTPEQKVHVMGKLLIESTASTPGSLRFTHPSTTAARTYYDMYSDSFGLRFITTEENGPLNSEVQSMTINSVGSVGFGTPAPQQKLHLDEGNLLITSVNSGTSNAPTGALLFADVLDGFTPARWSIEYLNSSHPTYGGQGLNFRKYTGKVSGGCTTKCYSILFLADNGRIGIWNKDPQATLDVSGDIKAESADISGALTASSAKINGIDFVAQNEMLLKKLDDLTLYIAQIEKRLSELETKQ